MALITETTAKANLRNLNGQRVFYLGEGDRLTPGARDFLRAGRITVLPASQARPAQYKTLQGAVYLEKPEEMTHLNGEILVPKDHPRIAFRGWADLLEGELLLAAKQAGEEGYAAIARELEECLELVRQSIRCDVLEEPMATVCLGGLTEEALRARSHNPQKYYGQPHFMPEVGQSKTLLMINRVRSIARMTELRCFGAFRDTEGRCTRKDLLLAYNRLSSFLWILEIRLAGGKENRP